MTLRHVTSAVAALLALAPLSGCNNQQPIIVPNRVLDRPLDVTLTCVEITQDTDDDGEPTGPLRVAPVGLDRCDNPNLVPESCTATGVGQLIGYVANSERNEVAVFRRCDTTAAVVDLDQDAPGYQLIPAGQLPSSITSTNLGCRVVTANTGSCDMTLIDGVGLATIALDLSQPGDPAPSSLVSRLVPRRADGEPLGARPGRVLAAPGSLSTAALGAELPSDGGDGELEDQVCADDKDESVWVTFPTCQLVAEVDLVGGQILQSRRFARGEDGAISVEDAGTSPDCPVDCPIQFPDGAPETCTGEDGEAAGCRPSADADGYFPSTLELVEPPSVTGLDEDQTLDEADQMVTYSALFVGGLGSDTFFELQFDDRDAPGRWTDQAPGLTLDGSRGVHNIRVAPPVDFAADGPHQFIYAIGGDGTTHVVDRDFDATAVGNECDTQVDPTTQSTPFPACNPLAVTVDGQSLAPDRRPFAAGPGIRVSGGAGFTDWTFFKRRTATGTNAGVPFQTAGVVGVGVSSFGRVVLSAFSQFESPVADTSVDPIGVMDLSIPPHSLWPTESTLSLTVESEGLPTVGDEEPDRILPGDEFSMQRLSPTMRRIDLAYALPPNPEDFSDARQTLSESLGNVANADELGRFEEGGIYENGVVRAVARDYQQWAPVGWSLSWEGNIPGTRSATGRVECTTPGWENGTCLLSGDADTGDARIVDESATFCDQGVLAGDKVVILGCSSDDDCGLGQRCLEEPTAPASATGICISEQAYEDDFEVLRQVCAPFINDACGRPRREFLVTRSFQNELHIQAMDRPFESHLRAVDPDTQQAPEDDDLDVIALQESIARYTCELPAEVGVVAQPADGGGCSSDEQCTELNDGDEDTPFLCAADGLCRGPCPGGDASCGECDVDADCGHFGDGALCVDFQCQRPCESGQRDCVQSLLPGPRCFSEFVDYTVRARNSFILVGDPAPGFITDRVLIDADSGECYEDPNASALLTSRLRIAPDEATMFSGDPVYGIPDCPNPDLASPGDPNPCRITARRSEDERTLFHQMEYEGEPVSAIRFSNPSMSLVVDLTDLLTLASDVDAIDANGQIYTTRYPSEFRSFNRARIPRNYAEGFGAAIGYIPISQVIVVGGTAMVYPIRMIPGATTDYSFIVDAGGRGGPGGVRGQIIRLEAPAVGSGDTVPADENFLVR